MERTPDLYTRNLIDFFDGDDEVTCSVGGDVITTLLGGDGDDDMRLLGDARGLALDLLDHPLVRGLDDRFGTGLRHGIQRVVSILMGITSGPQGSPLVPDRAHGQAVDHPLGRRHHATVVGPVQASRRAG